MKEKINEFEFIADLGNSLEREFNFGEKGFSVVQNLTGHGLGKYKIHDGHPIPNVPNKMVVPFPELFAVEPFLTDSENAFVVDDPSYVGICALEGNPPRIKKAREFYESLYAKYRTLPFPIDELNGNPYGKFISVKKYSGLRVKGGVVSQFETTFFRLNGEFVDVLDFL